MRAYMGGTRRKCWQKMGGTCSEYGLGRRVPVKGTLKRCREVARVHKNAKRVRPCLGVTEKCTFVDCGAANNDMHRLIELNGEIPH